MFYAKLYRFLATYIITFRKVSEKSFVCLMTIITKIMFVVFIYTLLFLALLTSYHFHKKLG